MANEKYDCLYEEQLQTVKGWKNVCTNVFSNLCGKECIIRENKCSFYKDRNTMKLEIK